MRSLHNFGGEYPCPWDASSRCNGFIKCGWMSSMSFPPSSRTTWWMCIRTKGVTNCVFNPPDILNGGLPWYSLRPKMIVPKFSFALDYIPSLIFVSCYKSNDNKIELLGVTHIHTHRFTWMNYNVSFSTSNYKSSHTCLCTNYAKHSFWSLCKCSIFNVIFLSCNKISGP